MPALPTSSPFAKMASGLLSPLVMVGHCADTAFCWNSLPTPSRIVAWPQKRPSEDQRPPRRTRHRTLRPRRDRPVRLPMDDRRPPHLLGWTHRPRKVSYLPHRQNQNRPLKTQDQRCSMIRPVPIPMPIFIQGGESDLPWYGIVGIIVAAVIGAIGMASAIMWWLERGR